MALSTPPTAPQRGDRATFAARVDAFITWLIGFVSELNIFSANLNSIAAGGAYAIPYTGWADLATVGAGGGRLTIVGNDQTQATTVYVSGTDARGVSVRSMLDDIFSSTSAVKAYLTIFALNDPSRWITYHAASWGYGAVGVIGVTYAGSNGLAPIQANEPLIVQITRTGDKGDAGSTGSISLPVLHVREEQSSTSGAAGANISTGVERRILNTVKNNDISGASLASNQVTLPAGKYRMRVRAWLDLTGSTNFIGHHKVAIYNVTDSTYSVMGESGYMPSVSGGVIAWNILSQAEGVVTISATKVLEVRSLHSDSIQSWGQAVGVVSPEVYTELIIEKIG